MGPHFKKSGMAMEGLNAITIKTMAKFGPLQNQAIYISSKGFDKGYPNCTFYWIWAIVSKVMGIYVKFYRVQSPNMVMTRDPSCKFRNFSTFA